jgi:hypothetical protein
VRADERVEGLSVLEDLERGHGADAELLRDLWQVVDIDLDEVGFVTVFLREPVG